MIKTNLPLNQIESMYGKNIPSTSRKDLVEKIKEFGYFSKPIPVIELPKELRILGIRFCFADGHGRYFSSREAGLIEIPSIIYGPDDDREEVSRETGNGLLPSYKTLLGWWASNYIKLLDSEKLNKLMTM